MTLIINRKKNGQTVYTRTLALLCDNSGWIARLERILEEMLLAV